MAQSNCEEATSDEKHVPTSETVVIDRYSHSYVNKSKGNDWSLRVAKIDETIWSRKSDKYLIETVETDRYEVESCCSDWSSTAGSINSDLLRSPMSCSSAITEVQEENSFKHARSPESESFARLLKEKREQQLREATNTKLVSSPLKLLQKSEPQTRCIDSVSFSNLLNAWQSTSKVNGCEMVAGGILSPPKAIIVSEKPDTSRDAQDNNESDNEVDRKEIAVLSTIITESNSQQSMEQHAESESATEDPKIVADEVFSTKEDVETEISALAVQPEVYTSTAMTTKGKDLVDVSQENEARSADVVDAEGTDASKDPNESDLQKHIPGGTTMSATIIDAKGTVESKATDESDLEDMPDASSTQQVIPEAPKRDDSATQVDGTSFDDPQSREDHVQESSSTDSDAQEGREEVGKMAAIEDYPSVDIEPDPVDSNSSSPTNQWWDSSDSIERRYFDDDSVAEGLIEAGKVGDKPPLFPRSRSSPDVNSSSLPSSEVERYLVPHTKASLLTAVEPGEGDRAGNIDEGSNATDNGGSVVALRTVDEESGDEESGLVVAQQDKAEIKNGPERPKAESATKLENGESLSPTLCQSDQAPNLSKTNSAGNEIVARLDDAAIENECHNDDLNPTTKCDASKLPNTQSEQGTSELDQSPKNETKVVLPTSTGTPTVHLEEELENSTASEMKDEKTSEEAQDTDGEKTEDQEALTSNVPQAQHLVGSTEALPSSSTELAIAEENEGSALEDVADKGEEEHKTDSTYAQRSSDRQGESSPSKDAVLQEGGADPTNPSTMGEVTTGAILFSPSSLEMSFSLDDSQDDGGSAFFEHESEFSDLMGIDFDNWTCELLSMFDDKENGRSSGKMLQLEKPRDVNGIDTDSMGILTPRNEQVFTLGEAGTPRNVVVKDFDFATSPLTPASEILFATDQPPKPSDPSHGDTEANSNTDDLETQTNEKMEENDVKEGTGVSSLPPGQALRDHDGYTIWRSMGLMEKGHNRENLNAPPSPSDDLIASPSVVAVSFKHVRSPESEEFAKLLQRKREQQHKPGATPKDREYGSPTVVANSFKHVQSPESESFAKLLKEKREQQLREAAKSQLVSSPLKRLQKSEQRTSSIDAVSFSNLLNAWQSTSKINDCEMVAGGILSPPKVINLRDKGGTLPSREQHCLCSSSLFSGNDDVVDFFLPKLCMACPCGKHIFDKSHVFDSVDPTCLDNILRPWQVAFLTSCGIKRGDEFVKVHHKNAGKLARAMREWRDMHDMTPVHSSSCGVALHIWSRTCKVFVRSVRRQLRSGAKVVQPPNALEILSTFMKKVELPSERGLARKLPEKQQEVKQNSQVEL